MRYITLSIIAVVCTSLVFVLVQKDEMNWYEGDSPVLPDLVEADAALNTEIDRYLVEAFQLAGSTLSAKEILAQINPQLRRRAEETQSAHHFGLTVGERVVRMKYRLVEEHHPDFQDEVPESLRVLLGDARRLAIEHDASRE